MLIAFKWQHKVPAWCAASASHSSTEAASPGTQRLARKLGTANSSTRQLVHMVHQCIEAYIWHLRQDVPLVPSCPVWANWWLLVLVWDNWSTWSINIYKHIYGISGKMFHLSRPVLYGPIGGYWCWSGTIGPHGPSIYTSIYMATQARCSTCPILSHPILSHPVPSHPISATA